MIEVKLLEHMRPNKNGFKVRENYILWNENVLLEKLYFIHSLFIELRTQDCAIEYLMPTLDTDPSL